MLGEGTDAPRFTLPGVVDGAPREVDIGDYMGEGILVLAFYPADFSPACDEETCDLTGLDLFMMQQDVDIFAVSPDSVFSHRRFAEAYSLSIPLLSDSHGEATAAYDVRLDGDQLLAERAVFVIDQDGVVQYAWSTTDLSERPDVDAVREAVSGIGGDSTAVGRYRVGHAHYIEGRRAFTSAMGSYEDRDWLIAQGDFERAVAEFQEAADQFESAVRFAESDELAFGFTRAQEKATALWQAAEWLAESASAYASGNGTRGDTLRQDAESPLETARDVGEPPSPDDIGLGAGTDDSTDEEDTEARAPGADGDIGAPTDPAEDDDRATPTVENGGGEEGDDVGAAVEAMENAGPAADAGAEATDGSSVESADGDGEEGESEDDDIELDLEDPRE